MTGRRAVVGLSLLSALLFSAIAVQSASAAAAKNTTAFTCVKDPNQKGDFKDAHCDETGTPGNSDFKHELITGKDTRIDLSNQKVTNSTKNAELAILKGTVFAVGLEIDCEEVTGTSEITNEEPAAKEHTVKFAKVVLNGTKCKGTKPAKCTQPAEPIVFEMTGEPVEGLIGPKGEPNAMGLEFKGVKAEEGIAEIVFPSPLNSECNIKDKPFILKGTMTATNGPTTESAQNAKESGATWTFTPKFSMQSKLDIGGKPAEFSTILTPTMTNGTTTENPISLTTTT